MTLTPQTLQASPPKTWLPRGSSPQTAPASCPGRSACLICFEDLLRICALPNCSGAQGCLLPHEGKDFYRGTRIYHFEEKFPQRPTSNPVDQLACAEATDLAAFPRTHLIKLLVGKAVPAYVQLPGTKQENQQGAGLEGLFVECGS